MTTQTAPHLVPMADAVNRLGISRRTLERMIERGDFPITVKVGRRRFIRSTDLDAYIEGLPVEDAS